MPAWTASFLRCAGARPRQGASSQQTCHSTWESVAPAHAGPHLLLRPPALAGKQTASQTEAAHPRLTHDHVAQNRRRPYCNESVGRQPGRASAPLLACRTSACTLHFLEAWKPLNRAACLSTRAHIGRVGSSMPPTALQQNTATDTETLAKCGPRRVGVIPQTLSCIPIKCLCDRSQDTVAMQVSCTYWGPAHNPSCMSKFIQRLQVGAASSVHTAIAAFLRTAKARRLLLARRDAFRPS
jgi:hypothetical protein